MAQGRRLRFLVLLLFVLNANGEPGDLKLCVVGNPKVKPTRTTKYCDLLLKSKQTPVSCVYAADRLECLLAVSKRKADFSVFEPEDLYFSTLWKESSVLVVSEIRALKRKAFQYGWVAMVRRQSNITRIGDLKGKGLCHPGLEFKPERNHLFGQYFEERVISANCEEDLSTNEDRIKTSSSFFGSACKTGPWSLKPEEDARLKSKYWNLCALCDGGDCDLSDKYRGSGGSLICFKDGIGDILWARYEDVKVHMKFLESDSAEAYAEYSYLCDNGTLVPLTTNEPCFWLVKPWQVIGASRRSATDVQKVVDMLSDDERKDWEENLLHAIELYLKYVQNIVMPRTPEDYLREFPGYLSASALSNGNCEPKRFVILCVTSAIEEKKCEWMSKAGSAVGIQPPLRCVQKANFSDCLASVAKKEADVVSVPPDYFYDAAIKYGLKTVLMETGNEFNNSYLSSMLVRKNSGLKKLSDLRGKRVCLTRKRGLGWWTLWSALRRESVAGHSCEGMSGHFGGMCAVGGQGEEGLPTCCSKDGAEDPETEMLRCLLENKCDAAVLDLNVLKENSDFHNKSVSKFSELTTLCGTSEERTEDCHWIWSYPHYLMTHAETPGAKSADIVAVFLQMGRYFGKGFFEGSPMFEMFGPFHGVKNVLFRDTSVAFIESSRWTNRSANSFQSTLDQTKVCSESSPRLAVTSVTLVSFFIFHWSHYIYRF